MSNYHYKKQEDLDIVLWKHVKVGDPSECWELQGDARYEGNTYHRYRRIDHKKRKWHMIELIFCTYVVDLKHRLHIHRKRYGSRYKVFFHVVPACRNIFCCNPYHLYASTEHIDPFFSPRTQFELDILSGVKSNKEYTYGKHNHSPRFPPDVAANPVRSLDFLLNRGE